jgi:hypothetical protein
VPAGVITVAGDINSFTDVDVQEFKALFGSVMDLSIDAIAIANLRPGSVIFDLSVYMKNYSAYHDLIRGAMLRAISGLLIPFLGHACA